MIKAEVVVVGTVSQAPQLKQGQDSPFYVAMVKTAIPQKEGGMKEEFLSVSASQGASGGLEQLAVGQHVSLAGTLHFRKQDEQQFINLVARECSDAAPSLADGITGELSMIGVLGSKGPEVKNGKKGPFMTFSAYSGEGDGDKRTYTWVRFIRFSGEVEPFLVSKMLIRAKGALELQYFQGRLSISSRLSEVKPYVKDAPEEAPF